MGSILSKSDQFSLVVPTYNIPDGWENWLDAIKQQTLQPKLKLIIDSSSDDKVSSLAKKYDFQVVSIDKKDFNHGGTRQFGLELSCGVKFAVYLTQDAILANKDSLKILLSAFENSNVGAAYGRQLAYPGTTPIANHARLFNYPALSEVKYAKDSERLGIKTPFISNSFSAYRIEALNKIGGFPLDVIRSEDMYVGAKLLGNDWGIAYCSDSEVFHSHDLTILEEFHRYFEVGVFMKKERWIKSLYGHSENEGLRFVKSELGYLWENAPQMIPQALLRTCTKYIAYNLGHVENILPIKAKMLLSTQPKYWMK